MVFVLNCGTLSQLERTKILWNSIYFALTEDLMLIHALIKVDNKMILLRATNVKSLNFLPKPCDSLAA